jgi:hypothetical protein
MTTWSKTARVRITREEIDQEIKPYVTQGFDYHFYNWDATRTECTVSIVCYDNNPNPLCCFTKEDLETEMILKFGARILKENLRLLPRHLGRQHTRIGTYTGNPLLKNMDICKRDNWEETYPKALTKPEVQECNRSFIKMAENPKLRWLRDKRLKIDKELGDYSIVEMALLK